MYDKFNVLLRNNEHFDQKLHQILLFNIFFEQTELLRKGS